MISRNEFSNAEEIPGGSVFSARPFSKVIAVSYFDNTTGDIKYNSLCKGITDMLITDLSKIQGLTIVEREKLEKLIDEIKLGQSKYIDPKTAQQLGKGLGAEAILTGAFFIMDKQIRIDARLIDVESSTIAMAEEVTGPTADLFQIHSALVKLLASNLKFTQQQQPEVKVSDQPVSLEEVVNYSEAIDNFDHGLIEEAVKNLEKTVKDNPGFIMAADKLQKVRENLALIYKQREEQLAEKIETILNSIDISTKKWSLENICSKRLANKITNSWMTLISTYSYDALLDFNSKLIKKGIDPEKRLYGKSMDIRFGEMLEMYNIMAYSQLKRHDEVIKYGQAYLKKYPVGMYFASVHNDVKQSLDELEAREAGAKRVARVYKQDEFLVYADYLPEFKGFKKHLSSTDLTNFTSLMQTRVIDYLEKTKTLTKDFNARNFNDLFETCLELEQAELAKKLIKLAHSLHDRTEEEERANDMDEKMDDYNKKIKEKAVRLADYKEEYSKAVDEKLESFFIITDRVRECGGNDFVVEISEKYLRNTDNRKVHYISRAWGNLFAAAEFTNDIKRYEELLSRFKTYKSDQNKDNEEDSDVKYYEKVLHEMQADRRKFIRDFERLNPEKKLIEKWACSCDEYKQYVPSIKFRKQLLQNFTLTDEEKGTNYFSLAMTYNNLGKFDLARIYAVRLINDFPKSDYASAIASLIEFMPR